MAINHQNNFATHVSSNQTAGVTTTPLDSIPSIDASFYIALDATNIKGHYEVVLVTSKTSTNINHAATVYEHSTDEVVANVVPAEEMDALSAVKIAVLEQDFTTNVHRPDSVILTGFTSIASNGAAGLQTVKPVTYGITFATSPIVLVSYAGWKENSDFNSANDGSGGEGVYCWTVSKSTGGFSIYGITNTALAATYRYGYHWIAIGTL
jgi:hypothetical protein